MIDLKIVKVPKAPKIKKVFSPLIGEFICSCGIHTTFLLKDGNIEVKVYG